MQSRTRSLWEKQDRLTGDRSRLFSAVQERFPAAEVLYPGSYVDIACSFAYDSVTYVDVDRRAAAFFADRDGVDALIAEQCPPGRPARWDFLAADYTEPLPLADESFDLLVSLYAGPISEHCSRYLKPGGHLLVNPSHGDAALASLGPRYRLVAAVLAEPAGYHLDTTDLDRYLQPKGRAEVTADLIHRTGRGVAYTEPAFAYVFRRD